jgi:hypothetical protein
VRYAIGDSVRVLGSVVDEVCGQVGVVMNINTEPLAYPYLVRFDGYPDGLVFDECELTTGGV